MIYDEKTIGQFTIGRVARVAYVGCHDEIGHVVGFTVNPTTEEILISMKMASNQEVIKVHPANLEIL